MDDGQRVFTIGALKKSEPLLVLVTHIGVLLVLVTHIGVPAVDLIVKCDYQKCDYKMDSPRNQNKSRG